MSRRWISCMSKQNKSSQQHDNVALSTRLQHNCGNGKGQETAQYHDFTNVLYSQGVSELFYGTSPAEVISARMW